MTRWIGDLFYSFRMELVMENDDRVVLKMKANKKRPLRKWLCDCPKCGRAVTYREDDVWLCRCDCGREVLVRGEDLRSGKVTSCGFCDASQNDK